MQYIMESGEIIVGGLAGNGCKGHCRGGKEGGDFLRRHDEDEVGGGMSWS